MSEEFITFIEEKIKDKELLQEKLFIENIREIFYATFPELKNSKWILDANRLSDSEFEVFFDQIKLYAKRFATGYGPQVQFYFQVKCNKCGKELETFDNQLVRDITSLHRGITQKYYCPNC